MNEIEIKSFINLYKDKFEFKQWKIEGYEYIYDVIEIDTKLEFTFDMDKSLEIAKEEWNYTLLELEIKKEKLRQHDHNNPIFKRVI